MLKANSWVFVVLVALMGSAVCAAANKVVTSTHPLALFTAELVSKANPLNALALAAEISLQLVSTWPQYKAEIEGNFRQFRRKIEPISSESLEKYQNRDFLALHDAYGHLARFYGLNSIGAIVGGSGEKPGAQHLWQLEKQLNGRDAICVLVQPQFSQRYLSSIGSVVAVVSAEIDPAASDYVVAKGEFIRYSKDIAKNLATCISLEIKG